MTAVQVQDNIGRIEALAAAEGLQPYSVVDNHVGNTRFAHELLALAGDRGLGDAAWKCLYHVYFGQGKSVFTIDALVALGVEIGLEADAIRDALTSGRYTQQVEAEGREARALGATGVPFVVIDRRVAIAGAQPTEVSLSALDEVWREVPTPITVA